MTLTLWACFTLMTLVAFAFLFAPLRRSGHQKTVVIVALTVSVSATTLYSSLGTPSAPQHANIPTTAKMQRPAAQDKKADSVANLIDGLAARLEEQPNDSSGWMLLARSYRHLGRTEAAAEAYARASALGVTDAQFEQSGLAPEATSTVALSGTVSLSSRAKDLVSPQDQVFIFAREPNSKGPPAAVLRKSVAELPINFQLGDSQAMVDGIKLSNLDEAVVTARISRNGVATDTLQHLEAKSEPVAVGPSTQVALIIE